MLTQEQLDDNLKNKFEDQKQAFLQANAAEQAQLLESYQKNTAQQEQTRPQTWMATPFAHKAELLVGALAVDKGYEEVKKLIHEVTKETPMTAAQKSMRSAVVNGLSDKHSEGLINHLLKEPKAKPGAKAKANLTKEQKNAAIQKGIGQAVGQAIPIPGGQILVQILIAKFLNKGDPKAFNKSVEDILKNDPTFGGLYKLLDAFSTKTKKLESEVEKDLEKDLKESKEEVEKKDQEDTDKAADEVDTAEGQTKQGEPQPKSLGEVDAEKEGRKVDLEETKDAKDKLKQTINEHTAEDGTKDGANIWQKTGEKANEAGDKELLGECQQSSEQVSTQQQTATQGSQGSAPAPTA